MAAKTYVGRLAILAFIGFGGLFIAKPAEAARFVEYRIHLNGKLVLVASSWDNGNPGKDELWNDLKKLRFRAPDDTALRRDLPYPELMKKIRENTNRRKQGLPELVMRPAYIIKADTDNPLQATLTGNVKVSCRYSYTREVTTLRLVRDNETDSRWRIDSDDLGRLLDPQPEGSPEK